MAPEVPKAQGGARGDGAKAVDEGGAGVLRARRECSRGGPRGWREGSARRVGRELFQRHAVAGSHQAARITSGSARRRLREGDAPGSPTKTRQRFDSSRTQSWEWIGACPTPRSRRGVVGQVGGGPAHLGDGVAHLGDELLALLGVPAMAAMRRMS